MKLEGYKNDAKDYSKTASELVRQFAFAGIAVIWIFNAGKSNEVRLPKELISPIYWFVITLVLDFFQYLILSITWASFYRWHERKKTPANDDVKANVLLPLPGWLAYFGKIICLGIGYIYLISYIKTLLN